MSALPQVVAVPQNAPPQPGGWAAPGPLAGSEWGRLPLRERIARVSGLRHVLARNPKPFMEAVRLPFRRSESETLAAEIIPLADACAFLHRSAARLLAPRRLGWIGRPRRLWGQRATVTREPLGTVLVIGPGNYPLMLPGIQITQALVAGNRVVFKPAPGTSQVAHLLVGTLLDLGVPAEALIVLEEAPQSISPWLAYVDKVVLTGSESASHAVLGALASHGVPSVMELSGCDAMFVLPGAELARVVAAVHFGLTLNGSATCVAPRRIFVSSVMADELVAGLRSALEGVAPAPLATRPRELLNTLGQEALDQGARLVVGHFPASPSDSPLVFDFVRPEMRLSQEDVMAPVVSILRVESMDEALAACASCSHQLGASVFGPVKAAEELAWRIPAGSVEVNDLIVPMTDPRLPFGGRKRSGFGVTRGAQGLLEMTQIKVITSRRRGPVLHFQADLRATGPLLQAYLGWAHQRSAWARLKALGRLIAAGRKLRRDG